MPKVCCPGDEEVKTRWIREVTEELTEIPTESELDKIKNCLKVFSHPLRLKIAFLLMKGDHCVCELVQLTHEKQNLVSHHLGVMRRQGVVSSYTKSKWRYYRLNKDYQPLLEIAIQFRG